MGNTNPTLMGVNGAPLTNPKKTLPIIEIFGPTIQGEGQLAGNRTHFIRFGGCGYRCTWCDSMHAVDPKEVKKNARRMTVNEIVSEISMLQLKAPARWITFSGGDPCMHDLTLLIPALNALGLLISIETQGQLNPNWLPMINLITVSPKPPSSGMVDKFDKVNLLNMYTSKANIYFKIVIFDEEDLDWAEGLITLFPKINTYLSVGTSVDEKDPRLSICNDMEKLFEMVLKRKSMLNVTVLPQLHVLAWGHEKEK